MEFKPHEYQKRAIAFLEERRYAALFMDMGLGKTVTTLTAIAEMIDEGEIRKVLVIAPKKVAESTWAQEAVKWDHLRYLRVSTVMGTKAQRRRALETDSDVYVTSRDLFAKVVSESGWPFDMAVIDELTSFKNSKSQRFKAFKAVRPLTARVVGLTGTPTPNGLKDLWAQIYCLDMGKRLGRYKHNFEADFFDIYKRGHIPLKFDLKRGADQTIYGKISDIVLTMKAEDYLELPDLLEQDVRVRMSPDARRRYDELERESVLEFAERTEGEENGAIVAANAAALTSKLLQLANGALYDADGNVHEYHEEKIDALMELIEQAQASGEAVLVFYQFRHDYQRIMGRKELDGMRVRKYEGDADLRAWNEGEVDVLMTHAASTAYGLNLQEGGHVIVWFGTGYNAELYLQGNARLHRQGQRQPTRVYRLVMEGTADEDASRAVTGKVMAQDAMLEALKSRMEKWNVKI